MSTGSVPGEHGEVERDEVAEQDERDEPLERGVAAGGDALDDARARAGLLGGQLRARALRGCAPGSSRKTAENGPSPAAPGQPTTSLWSSSGSTLANAGRPAFSLIWHFQR